MWHIEPCTVAGQVMHNPSPAARMAADLYGNTKSAQGFLGGAGRCWKMAPSELQMWYTGLVDMGFSPIDFDYIWYIHMSYIINMYIICISIYYDIRVSYRILTACFWSSCALRQPLKSFVTPPGRHGIPRYVIAVPLRATAPMTRPVRGLISLVATWQWNIGKAALDAQINTDPGSFCESQYLRCSQSPCWPPVSLCW